MRRVDLIVIHYTATPPDMLVTVEMIRRWHQARGFRDIGYHWLIHQSGRVDQGRPESQVGAHVAGHNTGSIGIAYVGGLAADGRTGFDSRTPAQKSALRRLIGGIRARYARPDHYGIPIPVVGHRDLAPTQCPGYDVRSDVLDLDREVVPDRPPR